MPVPSAISDLSTTPASNSPAGSETPSSTDDYVRTQAAFIKQIADESHIWCGTATGTANAIVLTPSVAITSYGAGKTFRFQAATNNSGVTTVAVSGLAPIDVEASGIACAGGEILAGKWYELLLSSTTKAQLSNVGSISANLTTAFNEKRSTVALTATTSPIWTAGTGKIIDGTGTPTITDFPAAPQAGAQREIYPAAGTTMTHGGNISVQGNASVTAAAGDKWVITAITTTTFDVLVVKKNGTSVVGPQIPIAVRQSIQYGPVTGSPAVSDLIPQSQLGATLATGVTLKCSTLATLFSVANGFNTDGSPNNLNWLASADIAVPNLTASVTNYIWVDTVAQTAGFVTVLDGDQSGGTIPVTNNKYTFDSSSYKMYLGNGAAAVQSNRLIVAEVDTNGTVITAIRCAAYRGKYRAPLTTLFPNAGAGAQLLHNVRSGDVKVSHMFECITPDIGYSVGDQVEFGSFTNNVAQVGNVAYCSRSVVGFGSSVAPYTLNKATNAAGPITTSSWAYRPIVERNY